MYISNGSDDEHGESGGFSPKQVRGSLWGEGGSAEETFGLLAELCEGSGR